MRLNPWSLPTLLLTIVCLNIWKYSSFGLLNNTLAGIIAFGLIGWWWAK